LNSEGVSVTHEGVTTGGDGNDTIKGSNETDIIEGGKGNDTLV
jgi:Ca2+-binding RTX toxin-like protein